MIESLQGILTTSLILLGVSTSQLDQFQSSIGDPGQLRPTVYYNEYIDEDQNLCADDEKRNLHGAKGVVLLKVCPKTLRSCGQQGSCTIKSGEKIFRLNILNQVFGQDRFFIIPENDCIYGYGVNSLCLDPYFSIAADLRIYKPGDVIFVPDLVGLKLPTGIEHNGFFVIRDEGRGIVGPGRFDFFSGNQGWLDPQNPFVQRHLEDENTRMKYYQIKGELAQIVREKRGFPLVDKAK